MCLNIKDLSIYRLNKKLPYFLTPFYIYTYTMYNGGVETPSLEKEEQNSVGQDSAKRGNF